MLGEPLPRPHHYRSPMPMPRLRPLLVTSTAGPAPASAPAGCFRRKAVGEVTCSEVVGKASDPYWLLLPPAPAHRPCPRPSDPCWLLPPPPAATWSEDLEKR